MSNYYSFGLKLRNIPHCQGKGMVSYLEKGYIVNDKG